MIDENTYVRLSRSFDFIVLSKSQEVLFVYPDLSYYKRVKTNRNLITLLRYLKSKKRSVKDIIKYFKIKENFHKRELINLINELEKNKVIQNLTNYNSKISEYKLSKDTLLRFSSLLTFFYSYENKKNCNVDYFYKLLHSHIVIIGLGGIGSNVFDGLVRAGVGNFSIIDFDKVEPNNLIRQFYFFNDINKYKVDAAKAYALRINPKVNIKKFKYKIKSQTDLTKIPTNSVNLVIICADDPSISKITDYVAPQCHKMAIPYIIGGGYSAHIGGLPRTIIPGKSACWFCIKKHIKKKKSSFKLPFYSNIRGTGIGPTTGLISNLIVLETIKLITGYDKINFSNKMGDLDFRSLNMSFKKVFRFKECEYCN